ncbi:BspA family leucine-rich repeat surface protein [Enterococcus thailandicus]|uniref:BspA family leucine-rich repeat surface protein n=1 Tax=Enterococcus TaxID=1350 RepID=UPI0032E3D27B
MKRKILIATILSTLVLPINVSYAAENEELLEETVSSELIDGTQESQLMDDEPIIEFEEDIEIEELQKIDDTESSETDDTDHAVKEDPIENSNIQNRNVNVVASGRNSGGMTWVLYEDGLLELGGGRWVSVNAPWERYKEQIFEVKIIEKIDPDASIGFNRMFAGLTYATTITGLELLNTGASISFAKMFLDCNNLEEIDVSSFNTRNTRDFSYMFTRCSKVKLLDMSHFDTSEATTFEAMFSACHSLAYLDVSSFNTENCTSFKQMFSNVRVNQLDVSNFNTSKATDMSFMFQSANQIAELDLSNFQTQNVKNMEYMFHGMTNLTHLNLQGFDVSNVEKMNACFSDLTSMESLDVSHFITSNLRENEYMFRNMTNLKELNIDNWIVTSTISYKFFENTLPEKLTIGSRVTLTTFMYLPDLKSGYVWADKDDNLVFSNQLIDFHNTNGVSNTYRIEELHTLTFDTNGGTEISGQRNITGKTWSVPDIPEKNGYIFDYWSTDPEGNKPYDFTTPVSSSLTLYAQYTPAYIVSIPASVNLNETNQLQVSAENYQEGKTLIISTNEKVTLVNTYDSTLTLEKEITKEKAYTEQTHVLEVLDTKREENTLYVQQAAEKEIAGTYEGTLSFTIRFY